MTDYIDRGALMQAFVQRVWKNGGLGPHPTWNEAVEIVESIPTANVVERKHGKWIIEKRYEVETYTDYRCPECGALFVDEPQILSEFSEMRFCPACGCDLRGDDDV